MSDQAVFFDILLLTVPHGIKGMLKARVLTERPERLADLESAWLLKPDHSDAVSVKLHCQLHGQGALVSIEGVASREAAELLRGHLIALDRQQIGDAPEGRYYAADLMGSTIIDEMGTPIGRLSDVLDGPGYDFWEIARPKRKSPLLLPILEDSLLSVNQDLREIQVRLPEGLLAIYDDSEQD